MITNYTYTDRPPIGVTPKAIHDRNVNIERLNDIAGAIIRYASAGKKIDPKWVEEYNQLLGKISELQPW